MKKDLEQQFDKRVDQLKTHILPSDKIYPVVDLTCLDTCAELERIEHLNHQAALLQVAAVCVYPKHLTWLPPLDNIYRATVVNFPEGQQNLDQVLSDMDKAFQQQADEIDYVFPYAQYLSGKKTQALTHYREAYEFCQSQGRLFKVILETGAWPNLEDIYYISRTLIDLGCPMLKTSTGKIEIGATLPAAYAVLIAIQDSRLQCGIKISGGIKTFQQ
ncbi:MAG TPA: deoxyribose-phosphate aldolase, partial [Legionellaceae bacterium]|nr:deoxyribose-phosphate aldolase [Legionellaceae bacterium]